MNSGNFIAVGNHVKLNYHVWGNDSPPMLLVHGLASSLQIWQYVAPLLAQHYAVLAYDQRGHGESSKPVGLYDLPTMLGDLAALVEGLGLQKPVVVGHSWGATLALAYAAAYPDNCGGLALVDGGAVDFRGVPGVTWESLSRELTPPDLSNVTLDDLVRYAESSGLEGLPANFLREYYRSLMEEQPDGTVRARLARENHMQILRAMWDVDQTATLKKVVAPMLLMMAEPPGEQEDSSSYARAKQLGIRQVERLHPGVKVVRMADTLHDIPLQRPERLVNEVIGFFKEAV